MTFFGLSSIFNLIGSCCACPCCACCCACPGFCIHLFAASLSCVFNTIFSWDSRNAICAASILSISPPIGESKLSEKSILLGTGVVLNVSNSFFLVVNSASKIFCLFFKRSSALYICSILFCLSRLLMALISTNISSITRLSKFTKVSVAVIFFAIVSIFLSKSFCIIGALTSGMERNIPLSISNFQTIPLF